MHPTSSTGRWLAGPRVRARCFAARSAPYWRSAADRRGMARFTRQLDLVHLARTTLGDPSLEGEMLEAFGLKASMLILRMQQTSCSSIGAAPQALDGS